MKTVLNTKVVDPLKQPLFCGKDLSLQRYDKSKHPEFLRLFKKQLELFWRPEEIDLKKDRNDFKKLADHEQFIFTSNLKFQTMLDSVVSRGTNLLMEHVTNPELEACFNVWQMFETIHSYAYTYIIQNVYPNPSEIMDSVLEDKEILKRAKSAADAYDGLIGCHDDDLRRQIYMTLINVNMLEGIRFYVSFVCSFNFGHNKKMVGNSDIISLIRRDEAQHMHITQTLINKLQADKSEGFMQVAKAARDDAIQVFEIGVQEEKAWADYLFADGSLLGLNANIMHEYIEWLCNTRTKAIGLPELFPGAKNTVKGWANAWLDSEAVQVAPQESEITSYKIGASKSDLEDIDLGDML